MSEKYVLYNPMAGNKKENNERMEKLKGLLEGKDVTYIDIRDVTDYEFFFSCLETGDKVILCGGDGTINRFINDTADLRIENDILYYATGTGNDFLKEIAGDDQNKMIRLNKYIKDLPVVTVKGKDYRFLNGVGYGIDGYCCEVGDKLKLKSDKPVNYTMIAIKGLLYGYKPTNARITVDGATYKYDKVWIAPTMKGLFYGGGMKPAPEQDRMDENGELSLMMIHGSGKMKTLMAFPGLFKGTHIKHHEMIAIYTGHDIKVEFDRPVALQIDGETILDVTEYHVKSKRVNAVSA